VKLTVEVYGQPVATGEFVGENTLVVYFPGTSTMTAECSKDGKKLYWSDKTVWAR
jgi:hypothetical protein